MTPDNLRAGAKALDDYTDQLTKMAKQGTISSTDEINAAMLLMVALMHVLNAIAADMEKAK